MLGNPAGGGISKEWEELHRRSQGTCIGRCGRTDLLGGKHDPLVCESLGRVLSSHGRFTSMTTLSLTLTMRVIRHPRGIITAGSPPFTSVTIRSSISS